MKRKELSKSQIIKGILSSLKEQGFVVEGKIKSTKVDKKNAKSKKYIAGPKGPILFNGPKYNELINQGYKLKQSSKLITGILIPPPPKTDNQVARNNIMNKAKGAFSGLFGGTPPENKPISTVNNEKPVNQRINENPVNQRINEKSMNQGNNSKPTNQGNNSKPTNQGNNSKPTNQKNNKMV